ncbi:hypothetical protein BJ742DRAFT_63413 [Cladochytrium replicatum]|nr:hypothetical protein BJ742DRAFT_63413 [Cladochytrium replicatum]
MHGETPDDGYKLLPKSTSPNQRESTMDPTGATYPPLQRSRNSSTSTPGDKTPPHSLDIVIADESTVGDLLERARSAARSHYHAEASALYSELLAVMRYNDARASRVYGLRASSYRILRRFDDALRDANRAIAGEEVARWYFVRGGAYAGLGKRHLATLNMTKVIELAEEKLSEGQGGLSGSTLSGFPANDCEEDPTTLLFVSMFERCRLTIDEFAEQLGRHMSDFVVRNDASSRSSIITSASTAAGGRGSVVSSAGQNHGLDDGDIMVVITNDDSPAVQLARSTIPGDFSENWIDRLQKARGDIDRMLRTWDGLASKDGLRAICAGLCVVGVVVTASAAWVSEEDDDPLHQEAAWAYVQKLYAICQSWISSSSSFSSNNYRPTRSPSTRLSTNASYPSQQTIFTPAQQRAWWSVKLQLLGQWIKSREGAPEAINKEAASRAESSLDINVTEEAVLDEQELGIMFSRMELWLKAWTLDESEAVGTE